MKRKCNAEPVSVSGLSPGTTATTEKIRAQSIIGKRGVKHAQRGTTKRTTQGA